MIGDKLALGPITTGVPYLMIPAFSFAISSREYPNNFSWSKPIEVIADIYELTMLVVSNLPPKPT